MKKFIITLFLVLGILSHSKAQENHRERIQAYKTAYITQELDLSAQEAEKFWPIYNDYEKKMFSAKILKVREEREKIAQQGGLDNLTDKQAKEALNHLFQNEKDQLKIKEALYKELDGVLSPVKLLKLHKAESDFNKKLLSEFRKNRGQNR
jgi:Skp family chaperone for outer membrane proteins